jgi:hypothetical protein
MLMVIPNEGKVLALVTIFDPPTIEDFVIELYQNNYTPVDTSVIGDFTPATFTGAAPITVTPASWDAPVVVADVAEIELLTPPSWTHGGGAAQIVYGWFMYGADTLNMFAAQRFDVPRNMTSGSIESLDPFKIKCKTFA